jgi:hypothetical protein
VRSAQLSIVILILLWSLSACVTKPSEMGALPQVTAMPHPTVQSPLQVDTSITTNSDVAQLLNHLRQRGIPLQNPEGSRAAFLYPVPGIAYHFESGWLHIHPFPSAQAAEQRANQMLPEMTPSVIDWVDKPHFYHCKSTIVLYLGTNAQVTQALTEFCGAEFAGS